MTVQFSDLVAGKLLVQLGWRAARDVASELVALDRDARAPAYLEGLRASRVLDWNRYQRLLRFVGLYDAVRRDALVAGVLERSGRIPRVEVQQWRDRLGVEGHARRLTALLREAGRIDAAAEQELVAEQERMLARENERLLSRYRRERFEGVDRPLTRDPKARVETGVFTIKRLFRSPESQRLSALGNDTASPLPAVAPPPGSHDPLTFRVDPGLLARTVPERPALDVTVPERPAAFVPTDETQPMAPLRVPARPPVEGVPGQIDGFVVERLLGSGGMGKVVLARRPGEPTSVAIKLAHARGSETTERFRREVLATSLVRHGSVVRQLGSGFLPDGTPYMVLEFVQGRELREILRERGRLPVRDALAVVVQILAALDAAHAAGVIHRDVKPENVLVGETRGQLAAKLMDFGLARIDKDTAVLDEEVFQTIATNVVSGSPPYLSPEQILGEPVDARADLYATGVVLFEMLAGTVPFTATTLAGVVRAHVSRTAPRLSERLPPSEVPAPLDALVARLLTKKAGDRHASARAVLAEIESAVLPALSPGQLASTVFEDAPGHSAPPRPDERGITRILARLVARPDPDPRR